MPKFNINMYGWKIETEDKKVYELLNHMDNEVQTAKRIIRALLDLRAYEKER